MSKCLAPEKIQPLSLFFLSESEYDTCLPDPKMSPDLSSKAHVGKCKFFPANKCSDLKRKKKTIFLYQ